MKKNSLPVFPLLYAAPIEYYALMVQFDAILLEKKEHFVKQSFRNRCEIVGANGVLRLSIPTHRKGRERTFYDEVKISTEDNWNYIHWRGICTAYRSSPYFEFYERELEPFFLSPPETLYELNMSLNSWIMEKLSIEISLSETEVYSGVHEIDFRKRFSAKQSPRLEFPRYIQVFEDRTGFISNLSILDLLFNIGPESKMYLIEASKKIHY